MTSTQPTEVTLLDTVVFDLLADGWTLLGPSYNGVAVERGGLTVELRPHGPTIGGGLGVATLTNGICYLGSALSTQGVADLIALRYELRHDLIDRQARIDRGLIGLTGPIGRRKP